MGHLVAAHLTHDPPAPDALTRALQSLPRRGCLWRLYRDDSADVFIIDVALDERARTYPFTQDPWPFGIAPRAGKGSARASRPALSPQIERTIAPLYAALE